MPWKNFLKNLLEFLKLLVSKVPEPKKPKPPKKEDHQQQAASNED